MLDSNYFYTGSIFDRDDPIPLTWWDYYGTYVIVASIIVAIGLAILVWYLVAKAKADHRIPRKVKFYGYEEKEYTYGSYLNPDVPEKEGYAFCGWFRDPAFLEPWKSTDKVKRDITLYPKWEKER